MKLILIGDTVFCEHRQAHSPRSGNVSPSIPEWLAGDDNVTDRVLAAGQMATRRKSDQLSEGDGRSRLSRGWPSISKRWRERKATTSVSNPIVRSAPPSRSSSARQHSVRQSLASLLEPRQSTAAPFTPNGFHSDSVVADSLVAAPRSSTEPVDFHIPEPQEDPINRQELASTPLLPPLMTESQGRAEDEMQSPLQSPSIAPSSATVSLPNTPVSSPAIPGFAAPHLATKSSIASFGRTNHTFDPTFDVPPFSMCSDVDHWAIKLGHANFHIAPEPYFPERYDRDSCTRLLEDWQTARAEYMRHAAHISEHYGPTSNVYRLTELKWAEIEAQWQSNLKKANAEAETSGERPALQKLATVQAIPKMPALNDPEHPEKFPNIDDADIVGPMVQYTRVERKPSKRSGFLKLLTDPASLLSGRSTSTSRR